MADPLSLVVSLLQDNWNPSNTDDNTPKIIKITDQKKIDFRENQDFILIHRNTNNREAPGLGVDTKHETIRFMTDVRTKDHTGETHFYKVLDEVLRIYTENKRNPFSVYNILDIDDLEQDLSDKMYNIFRKIIPTQIYQYNRSYT